MVPFGQEVMDVEKPKMERDGKNIIDKQWKLNEVHIRLFNKWGVNWTEINNI